MKYIFKLTHLATIFMTIIFFFLYEIDKFKTMYPNPNNIPIILFNYITAMISELGYYGLDTMFKIMLSVYALLIVLSIINHYCFKSMKFKEILIISFILIFFIPIMAIINSGDYSLRYKLPYLVGNTIFYSILISLIIYSPKIIIELYNKYVIFKEQNNIEIEIYDEVKLFGKSSLHTARLQWKTVILALLFVLILLGTLIYFLYIAAQLI